MSFELGDKLEGKYRLDESMPSGSSTQVFVAWDLWMVRKVVVTALSDTAASDPTLVEQFSSQARTAAQLKHPHIAQVYFEGDHDGVPYYVSEFVPGTTLSSLLSGQPGQGLLALPEANAIIVGIADALDYAAAQRVIDRYVQPSNIVVDTREDGPKATLIDFGITKFLDADQPSAPPSAVLAAADYVSPEVIQGATNVDGRSHVYSLGCTAFALATGVAPYSYAPDEPARLAAQLQAPIPVASTINPQLPQGVDTVFQMALAKSPSQRFGTCTEFVEAFQSMFPRGSLRYRGRRTLPPPAIPTPVAPARRRPPTWAWAAAAAAAVLLIVGAVVFFGRSDSIVADTTTTLASTPPTSGAPVTTAPPTLPPTTPPPTAPPTIPPTVPPTAPPPTEPPPPVANPYGVLVGSPVADDGSPFGAALTSLATRSPQRAGITPDSPLAWYDVWLRHVAPAPSGQPVATANGASFDADTPVTLDALELGPDGLMASAQECGATCQYLTEKLPVIPPCTVNPECPRWQSSSGTTTLMLRTTVYLRYPSVTQLFDVQSTVPIVGVSDPAGSTTFDPDTATFGLRLVEEPQPGTILLVNITYADGTADELTIAF